MANLHLTVPAAAGEAQHMRTQIRTWAYRERLADHMLADLLLVSSELFSNAVRASRHAVRASRHGSRIEVDVHAEVDGVVIEIANIGPGFDPELVPPATPDRPGGRGIAISKALGRLSSEQCGATTTVRVKLGGWHARLTRQ